MMKNISQLQKLILILFIFIFSFNVRAQLSGSYTIGSSGNYASFSAAVSDLTSNGVSGPVIFNVASGTYTEQVLLPAITGASSTNTITFQSATGDSTDVILQYASSTATTNNYTLALSGADYITFKSMTIARTGSGTYTRVIEISAGANYNNFLNNYIVGLNISSTSTNYTLIYTVSGTANNYNTFRYNYLKFGSYSIYFTATSSVRDQNNKFEYNTIDSFSYYGIRLAYNNFSEINYNIVRANPVYTTQYGFYIYYCDSALKVKGNNVQLNASSVNYGFYIYYCNGNNANKIIVANNFVSQTSGTSTTYGIYPYNCNYVDLVYNSINVTAGSTTAGRGIYINSATTGSYGNIRILNNNIVNTGGGYALEISSGAVTLGYVTSCNYNNFYVTGSTLARYNNSDYSTLSAWQNATSLDANSVNTNPVFTSVTDLHTSAVSLNAAATPYSGITTDFDNETRNSTTPDIGADEFTPVGDDAGIVSFESGNPCSGIPIDIKVKVRNYGIYDLDSVEIHWSVNDTAQTTYLLNSSIGASADTIITIGQLTFYNGITYDLVFWTEKPNNQTDGNHSNDTTSVLNFKTAMKGTYLIGSSTGADYSTISAAITDLQTNGICDAVIFNIDTGTYNEQIVIPAISGTSNTNTITFQSNAGDSSLVIITQASSAASTNNYTIKLDGADYLVFNNLTFSRTGAEAYCNVLDIDNTACNNTFSNNQFLGGSYSTTSATATRSLVYSSSGDNDTNNIFEYNYFKDNGYAFYYYGVGSTNLESGTIIRHNVFKDQIYGIYLYYQNSPKIYGNIINFSTTAVCYPIRTSYCDYELEIYNNKITNNSGNGGYGIYIYYCDADSTKEALIYNNFVHLNTTGNAVYAIYPYYATNQKYYYNSVNVTGSLASSRAIYVYGTSNHIYVKNNNFINNAGGYAYYKYASSVVTQSDYNNLFTTASTLAYWGSDLADLTALQTASGMDLNSLSVSPVFVSVNDLHTYSTNINDAATPIAGITTDIDGQTRNSTTPDIGADEFTPPANDLKLVSIISPTAGCGDSNAAVTVVVFNGGTATKNSIPVKVDISGSLSTSLIDTFSSTMVNNQTDTFTLTSTINTYGGGTYDFVAYTQLSGDQIPENDTAKYSVTIDAIPAAPSVSSTTVCDSGAQQLIATADSGLTVKWYSTQTGGTSLSTGDTLNISNLTQTTTYYAEAIAKSNNYISTTFANNNGCGGGNMFNIYAHNEIIIDSFEGNFASATIGYVRVYYRNGSYVNVMTDSTQWTFLGDVTVSPNASGTPTLFSVGSSLTIPAGNTYGIYIMYNAQYTNGNSTFSNTDLDIITGVGLCSAFGGTNADRMWNGTLYYRALGCASPRSAATITVINPATIDAGPDDSICINTSFNTNATASDYTNLFWQTAGDGSFSSTSTLSTIYTPGTGDKTNGSVILYLEASGNTPCGNVTDSMLLTILSLPEALAGNNTTICENETFSSIATTNNYNSILWTTLGSGSFDDTSKLNAVYTPAASDITNGSVDLILNAFSVCGSDYDTITISFHLLPTANAGYDDSICVTSFYSLNGSASGFDSIFWTSLGDGIFSNVNSLNSDYTPGSNDISSGNAIIILRAKSQTPCSTDVYDTMTVSIIPLPTAFAGSDSSICANTTYTMDGAANNYSAITWTTSGDGTFTNTNSLNSDYTPGTNDIANNNVDLILTATGIGHCAVNVIDTMKLIFVPLATVDAGLNDTICINTHADMNATATNYSIINWTSAGDGSFDYPSNLNCNYTPGANDLMNGIVKLYLTAKPNFPCSNDAVDSLMLYFRDIVIVDAGKDDTICSNASASLSASASNYNLVNWTTLGDGTFGNSTMLSTTYTPGATDLANKIVTLVFEATGISPCGDAYDTVIIYIDFPAVVSVDNMDSICVGETFNPNATSSNYSTLLWTSNGDGTFDANTILSPVYTPGSSDISTGSVVLTLSANNNGKCNNVTDDINLYIFPIPDVDLGHDTTIYSHRTYKLDAGAGFDNYNWSTNESGQTITIDSAGSIAGKKTVWVTVIKNGCSNSDTIIINFTDSTNSIGDLPDLNYLIYPNPTSGKLTIRADGETKNLNLELVTLEGKILINKKLNSEKGAVYEELDLSQYASGVYLIKLFNNKGFIIERILLK